MIGLELERMKLKVILNNDEDYERLVSLVAAKHNIYGSIEEVTVIESLNRVLLTGVDPKLLTSIDVIKACSTLINIPGIILNSNDIAELNAATDNLILVLRRTLKLDLLLDNINRILTKLLKRRKRSD